MTDPLETSSLPRADTPRQRFILDDTGFDEVPVNYRRFYRRWRGAGDRLAANEVLSAVLTSVHNVHFYQRLMRDARQAIVDGGYEEYQRKFLASYTEAATKQGD